MTSDSSRGSSVSDLSVILDDNRRATDHFCTEALAIPGARWATPRAPGKWSAAQVVEHVALAHEMAARALSVGEKMTGMPRILGPLARRLFFLPIIRKGRFPARSKGPTILAPSAAPPPRDALVTRLRAALDSLEGAARDRGRQGEATFEHDFFGSIAVADYVRFNELHTKHHAEQLA